MAVLERLRALLGRRAEQAYTDRDAKGATNEARDYAAGEAHAYGVAERDVRETQARCDEPSEPSL